MGIEEKGPKNSYPFVSIANRKRVVLGEVLAVIQQGRTGERTVKRGKVVRKFRKTDAF